MHKGVILLVKSDTKENVLPLIKNFMELYREDAGCGDGCGEEPDCDNCQNRPEGFKHPVWDWYVIGGRWSGTLTTDMLDKDKLKAVHKEFKEKKLMFMGQEKEMDEVFRKYFPLADYPYPSPYSRNSYNSDGQVDDILPLSECLPVVKDWLDSYFDRIPEEKEGIKKWADKGDEDMVEYCKAKLERMEAKQFSDDSNVYNATADNMEIPDNPEGWFAVMVDMHD